MRKVATHTALVRRLKKHPTDIQSGPFGTGDGTDLVHAALGLAGEAGEVVDMIKKHAINGHELDTCKLAEELGDVMFYFQMIAMHTGYNLHDILDRNIAKLEARYPRGYSDQASIDRRDVG